jgi:mannitol/fructose-specific phosphotransferase system IIA component (Ntr-type)
MKLTELVAPNHINLDLQSSTKEDVIRELIEMADCSPEQRPILLEMILKREQLGSTGLGNGVAIPHGRSLITDKLCVVCGVSQKGVYFQSLDRKKVYLVFLLMAPHREVSNQYLPLLGSIARLAGDPDKTSTLRKAKTPQEFLQFLHVMDL